MMGEALNEETQAASPQKVAGGQPGQLMWDSGHTIWQMDLHMNHSTNCKMDY